MKRLKLLSAVILLLSMAACFAVSWEKSEQFDSAGPVIHMDQDVIEVSIHDSEEALLAGVTAQDARDGDVTDTLVVEGMSEFVDGSQRIVNYAAFDNNNHVTKASRRMRYTDYTPILLSLEAPLRFPMSNSDVDILADFKATDCIDGDISEKITLTSDSSVMTDIASEYPVTLQISNSVGDTRSLPVTVTIYDQAVENSAPRLELTEYLVYTKTGQALDARSYLESVSYRGTEYEMTSDRGTYNVDTSEMDAETRRDFQKEDASISYDYINITDNVDYNTPGVYEIKYTMRDEEDNTGSVYLIVIVEEE